MLTYALSIFTGAFLLFQVQPLIGKYILPWFGGSPGVWTTCLLFFQTALLGGYAYAHFTSRHLKPKTQAILHVALLVLAVVVLPIIPADSWKPGASGDPTLRILALLTINLGLPYLVLSATGPLIQRWTSLTHPGVSPYRLYALSNAGSLLALLSYPFYFEWAFSRRVQASLWSWGLVAFAVLCASCALRVIRRGGSLAIQEAAAAEETPPPPADRLLWLLLPAVASMLLLATTNKLCQDLAVVPFLWVLPLALYLLSFILCFDHPRWYVRWLFSLLMVAGLAAIAGLLFAEDDAPILTQVIGYSGALFAGCMFCHGELYRRRPHPRYLTSYYLVISAGGALGGFLVAVVAPLIFNSYLELQGGYWALSAILAYLAIQKKDRALGVGAVIGAFLAILVAPAMGIDEARGFMPEVKAVFAASGAFLKNHWKAVGLCALTAIACFGDFRRVIAREWRPRMGTFLIFLSLVLGSVLWMQIRNTRTSVVSASRNFFGMLSVFNFNPNDPSEHYYMLQHGRIIHGLQFADATKAKWATTYYGQTSGAGLAIGSLDRDRSRRLGLVGLGTGTLAVYARKGDSLRIYEINPQVERLARSRFTYLAGCPARVDVIMGDARLSMEREMERGEPQHFDLLALDAFSSDAIPVHLLTEEAFSLYLKHLDPNGIIAVHISNRYFNLQPVVERLADRFGLSSMTITDDDEPSWWVYDTTWMLVARKGRLQQLPALLKAADKPGKGRKTARPLWTDDYTSLFEVLR